MKGRHEGMTFSNQRVWSHCNVSYIGIPDGDSRRRKYHFPLTDKFADISILCDKRCVP